MPGVARVSPYVVARYVAPRLALPTASVFNEKYKNGNEKHLYFSFGLTNHNRSKFVP